MNDERNVESCTLPGTAFPDFPTSYSAVETPFETTNDWHSKTHCFFLFRSFWVWPFSIVEIAS